MKFVFEILRQESPDSTKYKQRISFETDDERETVATALIKINNSGDYSDENAEHVRPIAWEAGCLQKKCGACAMLINNTPGLACDAFLADMKKLKVIKLAPLSKFPVIKDLVTDRSVMFENLKVMKLWSGNSGEIREKNLDTAYDASRCLQCGCCLEACPNFYPGGCFFSASGFGPQGRLISTYSNEELKELKKIYKEHIFEGCGKALACMKVCPAGIDLDRIMSRSNAAAVWRRK